MATTISPETHALAIDGKVTQVHAKRTPRGRWQYRQGGTTAKHHLIASGMTPAAFIKSYWYRDDFEPAAEIHAAN